VFNFRFEEFAAFTHGLHSQEADPNSNYKPLLNSVQRDLLDDNFCDAIKQKRTLRLLQLEAPKTTVPFLWGG